MSSEGTIGPLCHTHTKTNAKKIAYCVCVLLPYSLTIPSLMCAQEQLQHDPRDREMVDVDRTRTLPRTLQWTVKHALTIERSEHTACIRDKCGLMQLATTPPGRGVYRNLICIRLGTEDPVGKLVRLRAGASLVSNVTKKEVQDRTTCWEAPAAAVPRQRFRSCLTIFFAEKSFVLIGFHQ